MMQVWSVARGDEIPELSSAGCTRSAYRRGNTGIEPLNRGHSVGFTGSEGLLSPSPA